MVIIYNYAMSASNCEKSSLAYIDLYSEFPGSVWPIVSVL